jgi:hypothetical protein
VRGDLHILALQLFLLTSDHKFLVIGWLVPEFCLSEILHAFPGCGRFRVERWEKNLIISFKNDFLFTAVPTVFLLSYTSECLLLEV